MIRICYTLNMASFEQWVLNLATNFYHTIGWWGVILLMAIESCAVPFPSEIIMPLAGWFLIKELSKSVSWVFIAGIYGALGNTIGSIVAYYIGMFAGRSLILKYGKYI